MRKKLITSILLGLGLSLQAQVIDLSTGVVIVNNVQTQATVGSTEDTWTVKLPGGSTYNSVRVSNGNIITVNGVNTTTYAEGSCARWISPYVITTGGAEFGAISMSPTATGDYEYKMSFSRSSRCVSNAILNLTYVAADNAMKEIIINGISHDLTGYAISFGTLKTVNLNIPTSEILSGTNTIIIKVNNVDYNTGMFVCGKLTIDDTSILEPSVSGNTNFCAGNNLTFIGDDGAGISTYHLWKVVETNASGVPVGGSTEWQSSTFNGSPGTYTIPTLANGGPNLQCGKYYRVQLAVTNACYNWLYAEKIIKINCLPTIVLGHMDNTICKGDPLYLLATCSNSSNYTVNWKPISPAGFTIYNGPPASVITYPTVSTTYLCTITDNVTGCSATATFTATVASNDPSFGLAINTSSQFYATVSLTANDLGGYNNPGFYYSLAIQELNGSGTPYYTAAPITSCWWNYPNNAETFKGFISTGTGTYTDPSSNPCTNAGQFLYGHTYRITRATWNDNCPYKQSSITMLPVRSGNGNAFMVIEDPDAPDLRDILGNQTTSINNPQVNDLIIYPNPSNGLFTIEMSEGTDMTIEVFDMLGQKIKSMKVSGNNITLDLTEFSKGMYLINILQGTTKISKRVIIE